MSAVSSRKAKKIDPLSKKIPKNPRYEHIKASVDTGSSLTKYLAKIDDIKLNYKYRNDEIFKRMKITTLVQIIVQVSHVNQLNQLAEPDSFEPEDDVDEELNDIIEEDGSTSPTPSLAVTEGDYGIEPISSSRSTFIDVARGVGELTTNEFEQPKPSEPEYRIPFLILDVRESCDFEECHVISSFNYPKAILSKSVNYESKEMLSFKNKPGKMIVVYDEDERIATLVSTTLVQRGYDNIFMLSGGIKVAYKYFPNGLFTGTFPRSVTGKINKDFIPATKKDFDDDDISILEDVLNNRLESSCTSSRMSSVASSRLSARSNATIRSNASSRLPFR